jgi:hypothetical protein
MDNSNSNGKYSDPRYELVKQYTRQFRGQRTLKEFTRLLNVDCSMPKLLSFQLVHNWEQGKNIPSMDKIVLMRRLAMPGSVADKFSLTLLKIVRNVIKA